MYHAQIFLKKTFNTNDFTFWMKKDAQFTLIRLGAVLFKW